MINDSVIKIQNISKKYSLYRSSADRLKELLLFGQKKMHQDFWALQNISFGVHRGQTVGIVGKNGSGKSTLLKIITGVVQPTLGNIEVIGKVSAILELGAGFHPEYTGLENIFFHAGILGYTKDETETKLNDIIDFSGIGEYIHQPYKTYSSGMAARLGFSVAINVNPDILIVDEALSVGDLAFQVKCFQKFKELQSRGVTILFVTHSVDTVIKHCDSAVLLENGSLKVQGGAKEVIEEYRKTLTKGKKTSRSLIKDRNDALDKNVTSDSTITYGSGEARIKKFQILNSLEDEVNEIESEEFFTIKMQVEFCKEFSDPIFAFSIRTVDGLELTGTNSLIEQVSLPIAKEKTTYEIKFRQKMILNSGEYLLALGCTRIENGEIEVLHRLYDVATINVISAKYSVGVASSPSQVKIQLLDEEII